jgi:putative IMPACT (imprinted ancient) family translation regulator
MAQLISSTFTRVFFHSKSLHISFIIDDDGEDGAGPKLLGLLMKMDARGVLVVVSRWKSGAKIGPDRFRHFSNAARDALIAGKFVKDEKSQQPSSNG